LTAASMPASVLRGTFRISLCWMRWLKYPNLCGDCSGLVVFLDWSHEMLRVTKTGEWSEDRSRHDWATAKSGGITFVTQARWPVCGLSRG
jgi:hypothetical protein